MNSKVKVPMKLTLAVVAIFSPEFGFLLLARLIPVLILTLFLGISTIEEKHEPEKVSIDVGGIVFIMLTFLGLVYGFANMESFRKTSAAEIGAFVIGIIR